MAIVMPFRGVRYNPEKVGDLGAVVSPPYDVIDTDLQTALYEAHPCNVVRIIQGRCGQEDGPEQNRYTRASDYLQSWLADGILMREFDPSLYVYAQTFDAPPPVGPAKKRRVGIVALVSTEAFDEGDIYPHEHTMPGPKADRLELMRHTGGAFGQIYSLYSDPERAIQTSLAEALEGEPEVVFEDRQGVVHQLWRVSDRNLIGDATARLGEKQLFIADGHHRYETAVVYRDQRATHDNVEWRSRPYGYRMHTLVNMDDGDGMAIYPIHRVVMDLGEDALSKLTKGLGALFDAVEAEIPPHVEIPSEIVRRSRPGRPALGFVGGKQKFCYLTLKPEVDPAALDREGHTPAWRGLSSGLLQLVLSKLLDLDEAALTKGEKVRFVRSEAEVLELAGERPGRAGFFLGPVDMAQLRDVVLAGERMPPKSTYFYPKVYTGLVIQDMDSF